jgi:transporter family-2 protein
LVLAVLCGLGIATQARINGELGVRLHDGLTAAVISFGSGMLLLVMLVPALPAGRRGLVALRTALRTGALRPWHCVGGGCGAWLVFSQGTAAATLGVAVFSVAVVAGQCASSLLVDRAGIGPAGAQPLSANRVTGAVLGLVSVVVTVWNRAGTPATLGLAVLPALAGVGIAWQQAVNGRVRVASGSALTATFVNFAAGTSVLLLAFAAQLAVRGVPHGELPRTPWLYLGGAIGAAFIALGAIAVRLTGVLLLALGTIAGQPLGALAIDILAPGRAPAPGPYTLLGVALTVLAVVIAALPRRR